MTIQTTDLRDKLLYLATATLFGGFVVLLPQYTDLAKDFYYLLALIALAYFGLNLQQLATLDRPLQLLFAVIALNFAWIAFTFYVNGQPGRGASFLWNRHFHLLMLVPLFFLFRRVRLRDDLILFALLASVVVTLGDIAVDLYRGEKFLHKGMNPNAFGPILLAIGAILLFHGLAQPQRWLKFLSLTGCVLAITCVILSKSRNTWMTFAILVLILAIYLTRALPAWKRVGVAVTITLVLTSTYLIPVVKSRIDQGFGDITAYAARNDFRDSSGLQAIGIRVELWKTAWLTFVESPLLGVGVGGFQESARANSERFRVNDVVHEFKYAHNQYLAALATRGVPGLLLLMMFMLLPIYIALAKARDGPGERIAQASIIAISLTYLIGNLAEDHFETKPATVFVVVFLALFLARLSYSEALIANDADGVGRAHDPA